MGCPSLATGEGMERLPIIRGGWASKGEKVPHATNAQGGSGRAECSAHPRGSCPEMKFRGHGYSSVSTETEAGSCGLLLLGEEMNSWFSGSKAFNKCGAKGSSAKNGH